VIATAKPSHLKIFLHNESTKNPQKLHISDALVETYFNGLVTTEHECKVTNTLKEKGLKRIKATKTGVISYLGMPLFWPDGDIFGAICVFDTKENHYAGKSTKLMAQFKELIESHLALLFQTQRIDSLLESLGDIKESFYPNISGNTIITSDDKDNIVLWNRGAESLFGYESAEILGNLFFGISNLPL